MLAGTHICLSAETHKSEDEKIHMPLFGEFSRSSRDLGESDYDSIKSWDDRLNSPKSGV